MYYKYDMIQSNVFIKGDGVSFSISRKAFSDLDTNKTGKVELSEIKQIDANKDKNISQQEALSAGIKSPRDITQLNQALKFFEGAEPSQVVFATNRQSQQPLDFSDEEAQEIIQKYSLHPSKDQSVTENIDKVDNIKPLKDSVLSYIRSNNAAIKKHAQNNGVNPLLLTAIIFEEQMHLKPPIVEDFVVEILDDLNLKENTSVGPGQLGLGELIKQGYYASEGISKQAQVESLSEEQKEQGKAYLRNPDKGIMTLARQIARLKTELSYEAKPFKLDTYQGQRGVAFVSYIHNGFADYPSRVLAYTKDADLRSALYPPKKTYKDILPHTL